MSNRSRLTLAGGLAVGLCAAALVPLYNGKDWVTEALGAIGVVVAAGLLSRRLSLPRLLQPVLGLLALAYYLLLVFAAGSLSYALPTAATVEQLRGLVASANADINTYRAPVPTSTGLILLTAAGIGLVAVLVDVLAVTLQRAALAGLPLLVLFAVPSAVVPGGVGWWPFALGAAGWLLLLAVEGQEVVRRWGTAAQGSTAGESSVGRLGRRIGFSALSVAVLVPLLIPGLDRTLVTGNGTGGDGSGKSSSAHTYNPITTLRSQLNLPEPVQLFQYRTTDLEPDYIRLTTLDRFDGQSWSASPLTRRRADSQVQDGIDAPAGANGPFQSLSMEVQVDGERLDVFWLPLPYGPRQVDVQGTWLWDPASQTAFSASRTTKNLPRYAVQAQRPLPDRAALAAAQPGAVDPAVQARYGNQVPMTPTVQRLADSIVAGEQSPYARAIALQRWFTQSSSGFTYDLEPPQPGRNEDALEAFLTNRRGFCEQFATAMAALLRRAGIPSRVAVGFTAGEPFSAADGARSYQVTTHDAHAWPEAWFAGTGWVRFEPTPAESGATTPDYTQPATAAPAPGQAPGAATPTPSAAAPAPAPLPEEDLLAGEGGGAAGQTDSGMPWLRWAVAVLVLGLAAATPAVLTLLRRRHRWRRPDPLIAWAQLNEDADDVGHRWNPSDSPRAAAARLRAQHRLPQPAHEALERVAVAAERARYARESGPGGSLMADVDTVRDALRQTGSRWVRLRARVCPPSTVRWAATSAGELVEDATERFDAQVSRVTQRIRRPSTPNRERR